jgi:DNA-binding XRE family transcriptional regulator
MTPQELRRLRKLFYPTLEATEKALGKELAADLINMERKRKQIDPFIFQWLRDKEEAGDHLANKPKPATKEHLKSFRKFFGLSQEQAAGLLKITRVTLNRWEQGHSPCPGDLLARLKGLTTELKLKYSEEDDEL